MLEPIRTLPGELPVDGVVINSISRTGPNFVSLYELCSSKNNLKEVARTVDLAWSCLLNPGPIFPVILSHFDGQVLRKDREGNIYAHKTI